MRADADALTCAGGIPTGIDKDTIAGGQQFWCSYFCCVLDSRFHMVPLFVLSPQNADSTKFNTFLYLPFLRAL